ncbi:hypothetical protein [Puniceicoccus vermicola]|uniref:DUF3990 domain-containing protein n=1 Tax=Puniceicoccus vermicola TaxID=388746 RepID=A0A7X1AW99_9BACT|nr:hypothetical protein [Puniceicoccus vermicola]MBC2601166.1 hypothetical protein [Puniceicoccus vermicola]
MKLGAFVIGFHGCDREVGESLIAGKSDFRASRNAHDWLGEGIYFWENNPERALEWARFMARHPKFKKHVKDPFVVGAVIDLGNCLDLTEATSLRLVRVAYNSLVEIFGKADAEMPENRKGHDSDSDLVQRYLDCAVINHLHELRKKDRVETFTTVRGAFTEGTELYPGAQIQAKTHIQLCVRDASAIRGVFLPRE